MCGYARKNVSLKWNARSFQPTKGKQLINSRFLVPDYFYRLCLIPCHQNINNKCFAIPTLLFCEEFFRNSIGNVGICILKRTGINFLIDCAGCQYFLNIYVLLRAANKGKRIE